MNLSSSPSRARPLPILAGRSPTHATPPPGQPPASDLLALPEPLLARVLAAAVAGGPVGALSSCRTLRRVAHQAPAVASALVAHAATLERRLRAEWVAQQDLFQDLNGVSTMDWDMGGENDWYDPHNDDAPPNAVSAARLARPSWQPILRQLTDLTLLDLDDEGAAAIFPHCDALTSLRFGKMQSIHDYRNTLSERGAAALPQGLRTLCLDTPFAIAHAGLPAVAALPRLERVCVPPIADLGQITQSLLTHRPPGLPAIEVALTTGQTR